MPTFRRPKDHEHPYAQIANDILDDGELSFKAKGLLSYLLARSDDWEVYQSQLASLGPDGRSAVRSGIKELREAGFLERRVVRDDDGQFDGYEYVVYERRHSPGISETENSEIGKSDFGKSDPTNTDSTNTDDTKSRGGSADAPARDDAPAMPGDLLPLYDTYEPEVNRLLREYTPEEADRVLMQKWGQVHISNTILRLAKEHEWPYFVAGVVITANEANNPNPRYLDTLLTALTDLDEHTGENPTEDEQQSNLQRLWNAARTA